jgi:hypothetical protein
LNQKNGTLALLWLRSAPQILPEVRNDILSASLSKTSLVARLTDSDMTELTPAHNVPAPPSFDLWQLALAYFWVFLL